MIGIADKSGVREMSLEEYAAANTESIARAVASVATSDSTYALAHSDFSHKFQPWSEYPSMTRDVAVWVPESADAIAIAQQIRDQAGELLVRGPRLFDRFTKDGKTSLAFRLVFQATDRTLTDEEVTGPMDAAYKSLANSGYEIR